MQDRPVTSSGLVQLVKSTLLGGAVGDAFGVPVEFNDREKVRAKRLTTMTGFGTYHQPPGTFSDDTSLTLCLAETIAETGGFDPKVAAEKFIAWYEKGYWTADGNRFDIGNATRDALEDIIDGADPVSAGGTAVDSNGNGSLMRISPMLFLVRDLPFSSRFSLVQQASSITHAHIRSVLACFYYLEFMRKIMNGDDKFTAYAAVNSEMIGFVEKTAPDEVPIFQKILDGRIHELPEEEIRGSGYVIHCLEASIWCILRTSSYRDAVIMAVELGEDTDTTAAVTGSIAGLLYGTDGIPREWLEALALRKEIEDLAERMALRIPSSARTAEECT
jgi:ADP-ribosyl-[dinitrogen reductase] hydrolase